MKSYVTLIVLLIVILFEGCSASASRPYPCVLGCTDKRITPPEGYCYYKGELMPLSEFYERTGQ